MSKYKVIQDFAPHFITFTVVGWVDVFSRELYKEILIDSLRYCQQHKGLVLYAWVIMTNHVHLIISSDTNKIENLVRDIKNSVANRSSRPLQKTLVKVVKNGC